MNYLIVVAHSGDEILGCGGTIQKLIKSGAGVSVCVLDGKRRYGERMNEEIIPDHRMALSSFGVNGNNLWTLEERREAVSFSSLVSSTFVSVGFSESSVSTTGVAGFACAVEFAFSRAIWSLIQCL